MDDIYYTKEEVSYYIFLKIKKRKEKKKKYGSNNTKKDQKRGTKDEINKKWRQTETMLKQKAPRNNNTGNNSREKNTQKM